MAIDWPNVIPEPTFTTATEPQEVMNYLANYARSLFTPFGYFLDSLANAGNANLDIGTIPQLVFGFVNNTTTLDAIPSQKPAAPTIDLTAIQQRLDAMAALGVPSVPTLPTVNTTVPELTQTSPILNIPTMPSLTLPAAPTTEPVLADVAVPDVPDTVLPPVPTFDSLQLPQAPSISLPSFDGVRPQNLLTAPTEQFGYVEAEYTSSLKDPLVAKLLADLLNGGYGIDTADEERLWNRARDREYRGALLAEDEVRRQAAATSFPMPQGALFAALQRANAELADKVSSVNRDIAVKRADLYVENRRFTIEQVRQYEQMTMQFFQAVQERTLNVAKAKVELSIAVYDAAVRNFSAQLQAYQTEAQVFESKIRASLATLELYRSQIDAAKLGLEVNRNKVELYNAQLNGVIQVVNVYRTRMEAARIGAELQSQKLEAYRTRVQAYATLVQAKEIELRAYDSAVKGEMSRVDVFKSQVDAYRSQVAAYESRGKLVLEQAEISSKNYDNQLRLFTSQMTALKDQALTRLDGERFKTQAYQADVQAFDSLVRSLIASSEARMQNQRNNDDWNKAVVQSRIEQARINLSRLQTQAQLLAQSSAAGAGPLAQMIAAALNGVNSITVTST